MKYVLFLLALLVSPARAGMFISDDHVVFYNSPQEYLTFYPSGFNHTLFAIQTKCPAGQFEYHSASINGLAFNTHGACINGRVWVFESDSLDDDMQLVRMMHGSDHFDIIVSDLKLHTNINAH